MQPCRRTLKPPKTPPPSLLERTARALHYIAFELPASDTYRRLEFSPCPHCGSQLFGIHLARNDSVLMLYCSGCARFRLHLDNPFFKRSVLSEPIPDVASPPPPPLPLARAIRRHMAQIRYEDP